MGGPSAGECSYTSPHVPSSPTMNCGQSTDTLTGPSQGLQKGADWSESVRLVDSTETDCRCVVVQWLASHGKKAVGSVLEPGRCLCGVCIFCPCPRGVSLQQPRLPRTRTLGRLQTLYCLSVSVCVCVNVCLNAARK